MSRLAILDAAGDARFIGWQGTPPPPPDPDPPGVFTHGDQIFRYNIGRPDGFYPEDTRTTIGAPTVRNGATFTSANSNSVVENVRFTNNVVVDVGCTNITFRYCLFDPPVTTNGGQYAFRKNGTGRVFVEDSTFLGKHAGGKTIYNSNPGGIWFKRCLMLGSRDIVHCGPGAVGTPMPFPEATCTDFSGARMVLEDCFVGDGIRYAGGHVDCFQWDSDGGDMIIKRSKLQSYSMNHPDVPRTAIGVPTNPGNACWIGSYGANVGQLGRFSLEKCVMDGGNLAINGSPPDGPDPLILAVRDCKFGSDGSFTFEGNPYVGVYRYGTGVGDATHASNNTWKNTGNVLRLAGPSAHPTTAGSAVNL